MHFIWRRLSKHSRTPHITTKDSTSTGQFSANTYVTVPWHSITNRLELVQSLFFFWHRETKTHTKGFIKNCTYNNILHNEFNLNSRSSSTFIQFNTAIHCSFIHLRPHTKHTKHYLSSPTKGVNFTLRLVPAPTHIPSGSKQTLQLKSCLHKQ